MSVVFIESEPYEFDLDQPNPNFTHIQILRGYG